MLNIVLLEPEIPQNTGNIGRTCVAIGARLHLIEPMGFQVTDKWVRRAGLDYWDQLDVTVYDSWSSFLCKNKPIDGDVPIYMATTKARHIYSDVNYEDECYVVFGKESAGIPEELLVENEARTIRIPMLGDTRSLNLSNSVAVIAYEVMRQRGFGELKKAGELHRLHWK
ncbi:MAG: tRNA (cytidine(34)-2'-O)-methyltransferase [Eubacterium sp.]|nr:tRNA (cytidine(34)-2'-O)-methyltransferase [Eubacterium sp.]